jgi:hypothetical protein
MPLPPHLADLEARIRARFEAAVDDLRRQYEARLRQASESMLSAVAELRPAADPLEGIEAPEAAAAPRDELREEAFSTLLEAARAIDRATTQSEVLTALLASARDFAARSGLLLARGAALTGWGSEGFDGEPFGGRELDWQGAALERLSGGRGAVRLGLAEAADLARRLGTNPPAGEAVLVPLVLRDRVAAALYADGSAERPLELAPLQLLVALAAARIELAPLTTRTYTPTLYAEERAPGAGLPLWSGAAAAAVAAPPPPARFAPEPEPAPPAFEPAPIEPEPAPVAFEPEPVPETAEPAGTEPSEVEQLFAAEPPSWSVPEPVAEPEPEPEILYEPAPPEPATGSALWGAREATVEAADAGFEIEAEPAPPAPAAPPLGDATVRIPVFRPEPPPAPVEEVSGPLGFGGSATREVPRLGMPAPPPAAAPAPDASEDATMLMGRAAAPAPAPRTPVPGPAETAEEDTHDRTAARAGGARTTEVVPPPDVRGPGLAFAAGRAARSSGENALHEEAKRLARLLVSEIKLYNEEQVLEGRRNRDLYVRLREDIDRSRQIYEERVHESVRSDSDYFHQELVRSLAGGDARALGM